MSAPLTPILVTSMPLVKIPWVPTAVRVKLGTQEMEEPVVVSNQNMNCINLLESFQK